jgi:hypothetical protein
VASINDVICTFEEHVKELSKLSLHLMIVARLDMIVGNTGKF